MRSLLSAPTLVVVCGQLLGCSDHDLARLSGEDYFVQEGTDEADILFIVDDSISMADEQALVAAGFERFIDAMNAAEEVSFQLGVVTTDMDEDNVDRGRLVGEPPYLTNASANYGAAFFDRVQVGTSGSDKERGLQAATHALSERYLEDQHAGFLREDSVLALVFVSDEDDCSDENFIPDSEEGELCYDADILEPTVTYLKRLRESRGDSGRVVASAIVGPDAAEGCESSWPGRRYVAIAAGLGGEIGDICEGDYGEVMDDIGARISAPATVFGLQYVAVAGTVEVEIDGEMMAEDVDTAWWYDEPNWSIRFDGSYVPPWGSELNVTYEIAGEGSTDTGA